MEKNKTLKEMNMGELWALAKSRNIPIKGKKKVELIKELSQEGINKEAKEEIKKKPQPDMIEVTLKDGTKALIPAATVKPAEPSKKGDTVTIKSVDGRELEVSIGIEHWIGKTIEVPIEVEEDVRRILKEGGFYFI